MNISILVKHKNNYRRAECKMWSTIADIASAFGALIAGVSLVIACITQKYSVNRQRRQATIEAFAHLQGEVLDKLADFTAREVINTAKNRSETEEDRQAYYGYKVLIARLEHFAIGINEKTYDFDTFYKLGGIHVRYLYEKVEPIILLARDHATDGNVPFSEFEHLYHDILKKQRQINNKG